MRWASALAVDPTLEAAVAAAGARVRAELGGGPADLLLAFVSGHHAAAFDRVPTLLAAHCPAGTVVGCGAAGVIGGGHEVEDRPAVALMAAVLPGVELAAFHLDPEAPSVPAVPAGEEPPHFVLLADPFTFDAERFVRALDVAFPGSRTVGGLASGGRQPGANALFLGRRVHRGGCVGVALAGDVAVDAIVAQGCRPIGEPAFVTRCERNLLYELDGRRAADVLRALFEAAAPHERALFRDSLFLGVVMDDAQQTYRAGDFLIRNLLGLDPRSGALAVGAALRPGMIVQLHLRDAAASAHELRTLLAAHRARAPRPPDAVLLFSCLGRGLRLYGTPDHDTGLLRAALGDVPIAGFFCNGEIGPVRGQTFLHGYTSACGLFRPRR
jgi:small ligand-binding sensory domain FIST